MQRERPRGQPRGDWALAFLKDRKYDYQAKYRFIWNMDRKPTRPIIITSPEARQFCRPVDPEALA